jgi:hypothetical protein
MPSIEKPPIARKKRKNSPQLISSDDRVKPKRWRYQ